MINAEKQVSGCGAGLRAQHYPAILKSWPKVDWFEAISENFMDSGGRPIAVLSEVRRHYPIALHGVSLSIGSTDPLDLEYLKRLKNLADRIEPVIVSDHLCWSGVEGEQLHDLLPLPFTEESAAHVSARIQKVQEFLGRKILIENVSSYLTYKHSEMKEWEFITEISRRSGCGILLDINNIYVNSVNHQFDPLDYLNHIPGELVGQFHLAGHTDMGTFLFDTHSKPVIHPVWQLYREALRRYGNVPALIEWDEDLPEFERLQKEVDTARKICAEERNAVFSRHCEPKAKQSDFQNTDCRVALRAPRNDRVSGPPLRDLQRWIKSKILPNPKTAFEGSLENALNAQNGVPGVQRILVYAEGYAVRLHDALAEAYPAIQNILGFEDFALLAKEYMGQYPSRYHNLTHTGKHFPEFLKNHPILKSHPFLFDLAGLEWQVSAAFHAFDAEPFNQSQLAGIPLEAWENARLIFQPSVSLLKSDWSILDLWKARKDSAGQVRQEQFKKPQRVLVARQGVKVRTEILDEMQFRLIKELLRGRSLGDACESLAESGADESLPIAQWFASWVRDGLIQRCEIQTVSPQ